MFLANHASRSIGWVVYGIFALSSLTSGVSQSSAEAPKPSTTAPDVQNDSETFRTWNQRIELPSGAFQILPSLEDSSLEKKESDTRTLDEEFSVEEFSELDGDADNFEKLESTNPRSNTEEGLLDEEADTPEMEIKPIAASKKSPPKIPHLSLALSKPLTQQEVMLRDRLRTVTSHFDQWNLNTRDHCPWEVLHLIIANGTKSEVRIDGPQGERVTAIGWVCFNRPCQGKVLFRPNGSKFETLQGPGLEGHKGQLLGMLAQSRVKKTYPLRIGNEEYTVEDLIEYEKRTCVPKSELTFKLIGLCHYLDTDAEWTSQDGQKWSIERLVGEELVQPVRGAACGGTHRLEGLSMAVKKRLESGKPLEGEFARAADYIRQYQRYALTLQNSDGSFSTKWFEGREAKEDSLRRLRTTGHILEWLVISLPEVDLRRPEVQRAVAYLSNLLYQDMNREWDAGPLGHGINALRLYDKKVFKKIEAHEAAVAELKKYHASTRQ